MLPEGTVSSWFAYLKSSWNPVQCSKPNAAKRTILNVYTIHKHVAMGQNRGTLVNIKTDGKWMFIHPNMVP